MNKNSKGITSLFVIIILALAIVGGLGYYAFKKGQIRSTPTFLGDRIMSSPKITVEVLKEKNLKRPQKTYLYLE